MVISILMTLIGIVSMLGLPISQFPDIAPPEIQLTATYVGADAVTVEEAVSTPIEQQMSGVSNPVLQLPHSRFIIRLHVKNPPNHPAQHHDKQKNTDALMEVRSTLVPVVVVGEIRHP